MGSEPIPAIEVVRRADVSREAASGATDGQIVYAIGDVHGCYELLVRLLAAIADDAKGVSRAGAGQRQPLLLFAGDYVDRGPQSDKVLSTLVWLARHSPFDLVLLKGNHEAMMLDFIERPFHAKGWLRVGGATTLASYGIALPEGEQAVADRCERIRDELMDRLPASHLDLLRALKTSATRGDYLFVHAGARPGLPLNRQDERDFLWIRDDFLENSQPFEKIIVHGHSWTSSTPVLAQHRIGIDTGAYRTGALTAVRLGTPTIEFLQARQVQPPA
ncbi:metallophosphoesterase family protein [Sphingomonas sp. KR1UV-12]|uniref:Metallophosphoesterase family protein n=1 Tax=Sphingomonas aurea TaxID=3063994 RepID=A0ABT9EK60_9SPHN|nr:metallophosphoesterase family protein [Sphingomonas sp. KR1UV-12]MDP1027363.1 metallophosphoesterase family protein [Sphingomonas sp. KR1UV-12]